MKRLSNTVLAIAACAAMPLAAAAQQQITTPPRAGETALQYAQRIDACHGASVLGADYTNGGKLLEVQCPAAGATTDTAGMSGGLGAAAASAGIVIALFALAGGSSSYSTTSTTSTTGTLP